MANMYGTNLVCGGNEKRRNYGTHICGRHFMRMQNELKAMTDSSCKKSPKRKHLMDVRQNMLSKHRKLCISVVHMVIDS